MELHLRSHRTTDVKADIMARVRPVEGFDASRSCSQDRSHCSYVELPFTETPEQLQLSKAWSTTEKSMPKCRCHAEGLTVSVRGWEGHCMPVEQHRASCLTRHYLGSAKSCRDATSLSLSLATQSDVDSDSSTSASSLAAQVPGQADCHDYLRYTFANTL